MQGHLQLYRSHLTFRIQFEDALLVCDLISNSVVSYGLKGKILFQKEYGIIDRNQIFKDELIEFIKAVKRKDPSEKSLRDGIDTLSIALKIREIINECTK